ncbi:sodium channel and clathrin linker 1 [Polyodon spathula]|uniref:sodium channel and clathrin linker 1 n=1 Tax=Polyodon spathula TaxID=7913 RepID=UPI001B7E1CD9|nr:sodium channel and clathrin linker 1 [Polyodon spathula]XP_041123700.1 sodium channel and clathrin linker 1 [Polyodon spathula]XP_041123709.1 sodium channel and clathrin linker 1 [Polyodon spathula]
MAASEVEFLRDQVQRLSSALRQYQEGHHSQSASVQGGLLGENESPATWLTDKSLMAPLIAEYDRHVEDMSEQLQYYKTQMGEMKLKLENVIKENERLHAELRESIEKQLQFLPSGSGLESDSLPEGGVIANLQEQIQLSNQEKEQALELWQSVAQELDRLQQLYQKTMAEAQIHVAERQQLKDQLAHVQQLAQQLQLANQKLESTNQQFLKTMTEQSSELEQLRTQQRHAKLDLRTATTKVEEMTKIMENLQEQMQRREEDVLSAQGREEASDRRLQQLQSSIAQLETRLKVAVQEAEQFRKERTAWERQIGELQGKCAGLDEEKYEAVSKVRDSIQLVEETTLQKDQALLREKQKDEEVEKMKEAMARLIQDAAVRTRKEVENVRKQCNVQIYRLAEELSALQLECGNKEGQIERAIREKRAVEEELEKMYREGRGTEADYRKMDELHQRCLNAERAKDDLQITLQAMQNKIRKLEMISEEEMSRCQETIGKLQGTVEVIRGDCDTVSEERLRLLQENDRLRKEMEELRKSSLEVQRKAKQQVLAMEHDHSMKECSLEARVRELEDSSRKSTNELNRLLMAQQKTTKRWKEEARKLTEAFEVQLNNLKSELSRQKQRSQELVVQLQTEHENILEYEKLTAEYQEKASRLQKRLLQAEQRASTASQQLSKITSQRRPPPSIMDLETV